MAQEWKIEGKNVLITGGASGLGAAYTEVFLKFAAENVAILDVAEEVGKVYADNLNEIYKNKVIFVKCDVSNEEEIQNSFQEVLKAFKRIDVIINNAGIMNDSKDVWRVACDVNWQGVVSFTTKGIDHMRKDEGGAGGTIINISSTAALVKMDILPMYSGSKAAVLHFGRALSPPEFYDNTGVRLLTICFGPTETPLLTNIPSRLFDTKYSKLLLLISKNLPNQSVDSAVNAFLKMYREGKPGSVWLSNDNKPGQDITPMLDQAYEPIEKLLIPQSVTDDSK